MLIDVNGGATTDIMVCSIVDEKTEPTNPKPHIFYNINTNIGTATIGYLKENDIKIPLTGNINTAFHSNAAEQSTYAFLFSEEFSTWNGEKLSNNLYTNYHRPYINNSFNIKRRNFTFTSKILPLSILANLDLNDIVQIKENYYRIDKFTTDIITGKTEFNLVNAFDFTLNSFSTQSENILLDYKAQSYSAYVTNLTNYTVTKVDNGDGIDWLTITDDGSGNLILTVTENEIGFSRDIFINLVKNDTLQEINIYLTQGPGIQKGVLDFSNNLNGVYQTLLLTGKM